MNKRIQILAVMLCLGLLAAWGGLTTVQAASIGINFPGNGTDASRSLAATESAGFIPQVNWNNAPFNQTAGSMPSITDSNGAVVAGVSLTWTAPNGGYGVGAQRGVRSSGDSKLYVGYVEGNLAQGAQMIISGIPYSAYTVFVYTNRDGAAVDTDGQITIGATSYYYHPIVGWNGIFVKATQTSAPGVIGESPAANFCQFTGLTGASQTIDILTIGGEQKGGAVSGIQIVPTTDIGVTATLTSPANLAVLNLGNAVNFSATVTPASGVTVTKVEFLLDGVPVITSTTPVGAVYSATYILPPGACDPYMTPLNFAAKVYTSTGKAYWTTGADCSLVPSSSMDVTGPGLGTASGFPDPGGTYGVANAFNDNLGSGWDAYPNGSFPAWAQFQLNTAGSVNAVGYWDWYPGWSGGGKESPKDFSVLGSNDGSNWTTLGSQTDLPINNGAQLPGTNAAPYRRYCFTALSAPFTYFKFEIVGNHNYANGNGVIEIEFLNIPTLAVGNALLVNPTGTVYGSSAPIALTANLAGFTEAISKVIFYNGLAYIGEGTSLGPTTYKLDWAPPGPGSYEISFMVVTASGKAKPSNNSATVIVATYVSPTGGGNGTGFDNAFTLAQAIDAANANVGGAMQVFLKAGTYDVTTTLTIKGAANLYGGFAGTETLPAGRSTGDPFSENVTKLDGKGAHQILCTEAAVSLDRITFANGKSGGNGGGLRASTSVSMLNCAFLNCEAGEAGGGAFLNSSGGDVFTNCRFVDNTARTYGGGMITSGNGNAPVWSSCVFTGNVANNGNGGGLLTGGGNFPTVQDCRFEENQALLGDGGGVWVGNDGSNCQGFIRNVLIRNRANRGGGYGSSAFWERITNNAFLYNRATTEGGAVYDRTCGNYVANNTFAGNRTWNGETDGYYIINRWDDSSYQNRYAYVSQNLFVDQIKVALMTTGFKSGTDRTGFGVKYNLFAGGSSEGMNGWKFVHATDPPVPENSLLATGNNFVDVLSTVTAKYNVDLIPSAPANESTICSFRNASDALAAYHLLDWRGRTRPNATIGATGWSPGCALVGLPASLGATPDPLSFGSMLVGTTKTLSLFVTAAGGNTPVTITSATITGPGASAFTVVSPLSALNPLVVWPGQTGALQVKFTAPTVTTRTNFNATITITCDANNQPVTAGLTGVSALSDFPGTAPTVQITALSPSPTACFPIRFEVTFSEGVTGFEWSDIVWTGSVATTNMTGTLVPHGVTGADYTIVITAATVLNGTLTPSIPAGVATSVAFNPNLASEGNPTITYDNSNMGVKILTAQGPITDATTVTYTLTFTQNVQINAFPTGLLSLTGTSAGSEIKHVLATNPSTAWQVQIATGDSGTLNLGLTDDDSILSVVGAKKLNGTGSATLYGNMVTVDKTSPTLLSVQRAFGAKRGTNGSSVVFLATFTKPVTGLDPGDFTVTSSGTGTAVRTVTVIGGQAYVVCDVGTTIGPFALSVKTTATMSDTFGRGYVEGTPDPNEDFYILSVAPGETSAQTWSLY